MEQKYLETINAALYKAHDVLSTVVSSVDEVVDEVLLSIDKVSAYLERMSETDSQSDSEDASEPSEPVRETGGSDSYTQHLYDYINTYGNSMEKTLVGNKGTQAYLNENRYLLEKMVTEISERGALGSE